jgi:Cu+-exporting ATPase
METCYHCGQSVPVGDAIGHDGKTFCCAGCRTVYDIFAQNNLSSYYTMQSAPGQSPKAAGNRYDYLDSAEISAKLVEFDDGETQVITLHIPHIHCSSCIWILENLNRLQPAVLSARVNFPEKKLRVTFDTGKAHLKDIVHLLVSIGYEPNISLEDYGRKAKSTDRSLVIKLGVAFFSFGNIMLLSFPEYFEVSEYWLDRYRGFFRLLIFLLALPSFFYSASGYYVAAWKSLRAKILSIEVPIALGIIVMFVRSVVDMWFNHGPGFFDSMAGLIFFMLLGKTFQSKTYQFLSFERDYKSYFPVAVTRIVGGIEENVPVYEVKKGDRLLIRNQEIIPADGILMSGEGSIDYSFVTGESVPVAKASGDKIFAGGRQIGPTVELEVLKSVSQSYLTSLWSKDAFGQGADKYSNFTTTISRYFTPVLLFIACGGFAYWFAHSAKTAFDVFTAVLIVACPCALALTGPFTLGNILRIMGRHAFYLKDARVIEELAAADTLVFDKTGTLTTLSSSIEYKGDAFSGDETAMIVAVLRGSNHPLSRMLYDYLPKSNLIKPDSFSEQTGRGMEAWFGDTKVRIGSADFAGTQFPAGRFQTRVYISINRQPKGHFIFRNQYRPGVESLMQKLSMQYSLVVLSGDNEGERAALERMMPKGTQLVFNQKPDQKLEFIKNLQQKGHRVVMMGDGLNDAGALMQSNAGIAISENVNVFSPACDAILDASAFGKLADFLYLSKKAIHIMKMSFTLSLLYNVVGLSFAVSGTLDPIVAAIIMPLSTINIVSFVTVAGNFYARRLKKNEQSPEGISPAMTNVMFYPEAVQ